ncbi:glycosyl transferase, group 2 family protein [Stanieria sp. NIES-3757]|nr:glycosyl transferase, group 2 family protein [Stanieria sp. NIES-3757]
MNTKHQDIILSICIPTYNRTVWFKRALKSILLNSYLNNQNLQIIISDDSCSDECRYITQKSLQNKNVSYQYIYNQPRLGMAANWNNAIQQASGKYILILHDDDFLFEDAINQIIKTIKKQEDNYSVLLFGVSVVNEQEHIIKKQIFNREFYLPPQLALKKLLSNSSFVRFPAIVIKHTAFKEIGYFNTVIGEVADLDMWIRLFSKFGVFCVPINTCAYTIHKGALTTNMFNERVIKQLLSLFSKVEKSKLLSAKIIERSKSDFFHQFILAGTYRSIKQKKFIEARRIMTLFRNDLKKEISFTLKWFWLFILFKIILFI